MQCLCCNHTSCPQGRLFYFRMSCPISAKTKEYWKEVARYLRNKGEVKSLLWLVIALLIFIFQIATILLVEFRHPSKSVAWLVILFVLPIVGFIMYYFLAKQYTQRRKVRYKGEQMIEKTQYFIYKQSKVVRNIEDLSNHQFHHEKRLFGLLKNIPDAPITGCNETVILTNGDETYPAILEAMEQAEHHVHVEYYTIRSDIIGNQFKDVLIRKARQGVEIRVIYDGIGSYDLKKSYIEELIKAGVKVGCFLPPFIALFDKRINYRNHRKIVVVDGKKGFLGGINIGDEYLGKDTKLGFWRDTHMYFQGDAVYFLQQTFLRDWYFVMGERIKDESYYPPHECLGDEQVQVISSGPDKHWDAILEMMFAAITTAKQRIWIASPYFIPDETLLMALKTAAFSGVDVKILYPAVPDSILVKYASISYFEELMQAGVRFYVYKKGFIHAKVLLIDHLLTSVGTANMDMRSFFSNFEINAVMFDLKTIHRIEKDFHQDFLDSEELLLHDFEKRSRIQRGKEVAARLLSPLL